mmetsp:Transcript_44407/g.117544  ORF Transcript_44407/g.117544 Transcript_44407/m.117544 type:complete len:221 (+) Transcript_44407:93-755(+)
MGAAGAVGCCCQEREDPSDKERGNVQNAAKLPQFRDAIGPRPTPRVTLLMSARAAVRNETQHSGGNPHLDFDLLDERLKEGPAFGFAASAEQRKQARQMLADAMKNREEEALRRAVALADEALLDTREVESALAMIGELEALGSADGIATRRRAQAVERLEKAIRSLSHKELESAIAEAEAAGLGTKQQRALLAEARLTLRMVHDRRSVTQARRKQDRGV